MLASKNKIKDYLFEDNLSQIFHSIRKINFLLINNNSSSNVFLHIKIGYYIYVNAIIFDIYK